MKLILLIKTRFVTRSQFILHVLEMMFRNDVIVFIKLNLKWKINRMSDTIQSKPKVK